MYLHYLLAVLVVLISVPGAATGAGVEDGQALFEQHCASCHGAPTDVRTPSRFQLSRMNPLAMLTTLTGGKMMAQAASLSTEQKRALVEAITRRELAELTILESAFCKTRTAPVTAASPVFWSGWGGGKAAMGYAGPDAAKLTPADLKNLELKWAMAFPGASQARSQPAIIGNTVFVGSAEGAVYALDATSGCIYWRINTPGPVRGAIEVGAPIDDAPTLHFASYTTDVYAVNARSGQVLWQRHVAYESLNGVTGSPVYHDDRLYIPLTSGEVGAARNPDHECCTSSGGVVALDARDGSEIWYFRTTGAQAREVGRTKAGKRLLAPSGAPVWASPTLDVQRSLLYIGTGENYSRPTTKTSDAIIALELATGEIAWSYQGTADDAWHGGCRSMPDVPPCDDVGPDLDFGMSPIIATLEGGKRVLLAGQKSAMVYGFDPDDAGKLLWKTRVGKGSALGGIHWGMATDNEYVYVTNSDRPFIIRDVNPGTELAPGMYALDVRTGEIRWKQPTPGKRCTIDSTRNQPRGSNRCLSANSAAPATIDGLVFAGDLNGVLRAYAAGSGEILWSYDTNRAFTAVNGIPAKGGSIDGPAPVIANGMVYVNSGYGSFGQLPGNVLLAFGVKH